MSISAVILTKNSSKTLEKCIESVKFCGEILVVDDESTDETVHIAKKYNAKVFEKTLGNDFSAQRNFGLEKASSEWVLFVDSDEVVPDSLQYEIENYINNPVSNFEGFYIKRNDYMWGEKLQHGEVGDIWLLRLAKKDSGIWKGKVHEVWNVKGNTKRLQNTLVHFPHPTISEFLSKINFYSTLRAEELHKKGVKASWVSILAYPKAKFFVNYVLKRGFLDGIPGLIIAILMSFHSYLVRGKLWQMRNS